MKTRILLVMSLGLLIAAEKPKADVAKVKLKLLQGVWKISAGEANGAKMSEDDLKKAPQEVTIKGKMFTVELPQGSGDGTFTIDPTKKPATIDASGSDGNNVKAIYEVKGNLLKICFDKSGGERPTTFDTAGQSDWVLLIFKREKKKAD